jgi:hypothetical protein
MLRKFGWMGFCLAVVALTGLARADDDMIDNPAYQAWAKFKQGTSVTYSTDSTAMGNTTSSTTTSKLTDLTPDKATVQVTTSMNVGGNKMDMPAQTQDIPAKIKKPSDTGGDQTTDKPKTETGSEDVTAAGNTYSCKKTTVTLDQNGMTIKVTTWTCDKVPSGVVKTDTETSGSVTASVKMALTAVDVK